MWNRKITILILIIAVMTVVSGCWKKEVKPVIRDTGEQPIATSTDKIDISDWQIYKNEEYGFELKYPKEWYWEDYTKEFNIGKPVIGFYPNNQKKDWEYYGDIELEILENKKKIDIEKFFKILYSDMPFLFDEIITGNTKNGYNYIKRIDIPGNVDHDFIYVQCANKIISIGTPFGVARNILDDVADTINCQK